VFNAAIEFTGTGPLLAIDDWRDFQKLGISTVGDETTFMMAIDGLRANGECKQLLLLEMTRTDYVVFNSPRPPAVFTLSPW